MELTNHGGLALERQRTELSEGGAASSSMLNPEDGCIVLGQDAGRGNKYVTRCRIDRTKQRHHLAGHVLEEECCPCKLPENRESLKRFIPAVLTSEPLMLTLHLSAVIVMTVKESLDLRRVDEDLHLTASIIETYVAVHLIVTRIAAAWQGFKALRRERTRIEFVQEGVGLRTPRLRQVVVMVTVFGGFLIGGALAAFILFFYFAHLGWTILSNNFCIIMITATSGVLSARIDLELEGIRSDQHKAVIYETVTLLTESLSHSHTETDSEQHFHDKVEHFCKALRDTDMFQRPDYITLPQRHMNTIAQLQFQSLV